MKTKTKRSRKTSSEKHCTFGDTDKYLFAEGNHERVYQNLGAHLSQENGEDGVQFRVWAPNARSVQIIAEFNNWDGSGHVMHGGDSGVWHLFIPGIKENDIYKYQITSQDGKIFDKADPYGFAMEQRPETGSIVYDLDRYQWNDAEWVKNREKRQALDQPLSIYEVHLGSWKKLPDPEWQTRYLTYRECADTLLPYVKEMGYTHIELMPITEHPYDKSWGYQVMGFYAPTSRFGTPEDFMYLVDCCHQQGVGVILDWVPGHFPKDGAGLNYFDGTHLYAHEDPRQGEHRDWGTMIFNYGRSEVRSFLISNAVFWLDKYHLDGLRVDAVASMLYLDYSREDGDWVPNKYGGRENLEAIDFIRRMNEVVHRDYPGVLTIAEESTSWPMVSRPTYAGGLGFTLKWNMGWMHDTLQYMSKDPLYRRYHHSEMTFGMLYAFQENFVLALSHDEVVHGKASLLNKMPGDEWQKFANLRAYYGFKYGYSGKKLLFMGSEFGQWQEWNDEQGLEWDALGYPMHKGVQEYVKALNHLYVKEPALYENDFDDKGFSWIEADDYMGSVFSFCRYNAKGDDFVIVVSNFTPETNQNYRFGVPEKGSYVEILNSDNETFAGSGILNNGVLKSEKDSMHGREHSLQINLPPLATVFLKLKKKKSKK